MSEKTGRQLLRLGVALAFICLATMGTWERLVAASQPDLKVQVSLDPDTIGLDGQAVLDRARTLGREHDLAGFIQ